MVTAFIGIPIVLACLWSTSPWPLAILLSAAGFLALAELWELLEFKTSKILTLLTAVTILAPVVFATVLTKRDALDLPAFALPWLAGIGALTWIWAEKWIPLKRILGIGYVLGPLIAILAIHSLSWPQSGQWNLKPPTILAIFPVWAGDTAGILVGSKFGKRRLWPELSPNKTWEGAIANLVAATLCGWGFSYVTGHSPTVGLLCGATIGILGQLGDLFESWLKRNAKRKDSGSLLPGHGGILDRVDSVLTTAIPIYAILLAFK